MGSNVVKELNQAWLGLYNPSQPFRSHEWTKHGSCWDENDDLVPQEKGMSTEEEYFETALKLWKDFDLYAFLKKAGITPNSNIQYNTDDILSAFSSNFNRKKVILLCTKDKNRNLFLESVSICLNEKY